ncbi:GNAT family N-acetyltransferase, partial [Bacteroidota bacterium]
KEKNAQALPRGSVSFYVRYIKPSEAVDVSRCAYSSYGYTYAYENIYYPERVNELNKSGNLISHIAVTDNEEIIGHAALIFQNKDDKTAELGVAFVKPKYRGQGCLQQISMARLETARKKKLTGVFMHAVTTHVFSQKPAHKNGFKDCALYLSRISPIEFKSISDEIKQRESVVLSFLFLDKPEEHKLFVPKHHKRILSKIFKKLEVNPELIDKADKDDNIGNESKIKVSTDNWQAAKLVIEEYGKDVVNEVSKSLKSLCIERFETIYLYQKMTDVNILYFTEKFEALGFFFCGILPGSNGEDRMILQYLNNQVLDYNLIKLDSDIGNAMLEYIKQRDPNNTIKK